LRPIRSARRHVARVGLLEEQRDQVFALDRRVPGAGREQQRLALELQRAAHG
jgi:hypothetical protein